MVNVKFYQLQTKLKSHHAFGLTARSNGPKEDYFCRAFMPMFGIPEDPVCGALNCLLGPYWSRNLDRKPGECVISRQLSLRRGELEILWVREERVCLLRGHAIVIGRGELFV